MTINFVGQTSILGDSAREQRIRALAQQLSLRRHAVTAFSAVEKHTRRFENLAIRYTPSFSPEHPGGWLYTAITVLRAAFAFPEVIHVMSWKAATFTPLIVAIHPEATLVWTIDSAPQKLSRSQRFIVWVNAKLCDAIVTPTRSLQYQIRLQCNVLPAYVPDGYSPVTLRDIPVSRWKLRKGQYTLVVANTAEAVASLCKAAAKAEHYKKLVVLVSATNPRLQRLEKRYKFLRLVTASSARQRSSLIRQAGSVMFLEAAASHELLLAMDSGKPVSAANTTLSQEIAATTATYFKAGNAKDAAEILASKTGAANKNARVRARAHFTWTRIFDEYQTLYHYPRVRRVSLDSIQPSHHAQPAVY